MRADKVVCADKTVKPEFLDRSFDCTVCGGVFTVTKRTTVVVVAKPNTLGCHCPYCKQLTPFVNDVHANYKARLEAFIHSQVEPIKSIEDANIRTPMAKLLDDFNALLQD